MPAIISTVTKVRMEGAMWGPADKKCEWMLNATDITEVDGAQYVNITPHRYELVRLIAQGLPGFIDVQKNYSLTRAMGLQELCEARNKAAWPPHTLSTLFGARAARGETANVPRKRHSVAVAPTVPLRIPACGPFPERTTLAKRPSHPTERLAVPLEADVLEHCLLYVRLGEFADDPCREKFRGPRNIWHNKQRDSYLVVSKDAGSQKKLKFATARTLDEAMLLHAAQADEQTCSTDDTVGEIGPHA